MTYTDRTRVGDGGFTNTATSDPTRAVQPNADNRAPKFGEGASTFRVVMENAKPNETDDDTTDDVDESTQGDVGGPIAATDDNGDTLSYTLGGPDKDLFMVGTDGQLEVKAGANLNYESQASHTVTITANDGLWHSQQHRHDHGDHLRHRRR